MPMTSTGWLCLFALFISVYFGSHLATLHVLAGFGKARYSLKDTLAMFLFLCIMMISTSLFIYVEPATR